MRVRLVIFLAVLGLWSAVVCARLIQLQVVDHDRYARAADDQQQRDLVLASPRGAIYDARGRELAVSLTVRSAFLDPSDERLPPPAELAGRIAGLVPGLDERRLARQLEGKRAAGAKFAWIARQLDPPIAQRLERAGVPGLTFKQESKRYYPLRGAAASVLGIVGRDDRGLGGLEYLYDDVLRGRAQERRVLLDGAARASHVAELEFADPQPGAVLHLTLDASIQHVAERELARAVESHRAKGGTAVVLDPASGAILALASYPEFDPNRFADFPAGHRRVQAVTDTFEPGSTFKMVVAAAALESNAIDPEDRVDCGMGAITLDRVRIRDHHPYGLLTFREVIAKSSNVGALRVGMRVGSRDLYDMIRAFGFGRPTGVDLPAESPGILAPVEAWRPITTAYVSFGQGLAVTALQIVNAFAAVANEGLLYRPHVVAAVERDGRLERKAPELAGRALPPSVAREVERLLEAVVEQGTGRKAAVPGYRVAGKTGTGQKALPGEGYSDTRVVASFVGFAPARRPRVACVVAVDEPLGVIHGGDVAAPAFAAIVRHALNYLGVEPEWEAEPESPVAVAESQLAVRRPEAPASPAQADAAPQQAVALTPAASGPTLPDLIGLSARQAVARSAQLGLDVRLHGSGFVRHQEPAAGTPLAPAGAAVELWLGGAAMAPERAGGAGR